MANDVAAASLSQQQKKRSLNARKNKAPAVKTVLCTPYVAKWLVVFVCDCGCAVLCAVLIVVAVGSDRLYL